METENLEQNIVGYNWWGERYSFVLVDSEAGTNSVMLMANGPDHGLEGPDADTWHPVANFPVEAATAITVIAELMNCGNKTEIYSLTQAPVQSEESDS